MSTALLYHDDPQLLTFEATVLAHHAQGGVVLDRTAFYPEGGGQLSDRGVLADRAITDVQIDDAGIVRHALVGGELPAIGSVVRGAVDRPRRRLFAALHTAQHMLSRALIETARAETVSARLGESTCTVDLDVPSLSEGDLGRAEVLVNDLIEDDLAIRAWFPEPGELASLPLRRAPKVSEHVRVVQIGDFDVSPCGGTHCTRSAQVGMIEVLGVERYKGMMRVSFAAGRRARALLEHEAEALRGLARTFTCGPLEVPLAVEKLRGSLASSEARGGKLGARVAAVLTAELLASGADPVVAVLDDVDIALVRTVAARLTEAGRFAIVGARDEDGIALVVSRPGGRPIDAGGFLRALATRTGGKGGGRPDRAEGRLPADADVASTVAAILEAR